MIQNNPEVKIHVFLAAKKQFLITTSFAAFLKK